MLVTTVALVAFVAALVWLWRRKARDTADCAAILGLSPAPRTFSRGTTAEGFAYGQTILLSGMLQGFPATLTERRVRRPRAPSRQRQGSQFTVLALTLPSAPPARLRLQPRGVLRMVEVAVGSESTPVPVDAAFDEAYLLYTDDPHAALRVLTPAVRADLLAFRAAFSTADPSSLAGRASSGLVLGSFEVGQREAIYSLYGSPMKATATQVKAAVPLLARLACSRPE